MKKNICIISISDKLGGAEQTLFKIAKFYSKEDNVKIYFLKPKSNKFWRENLNQNVKLVYLNNNILLFFKIFRKQDFKIVFSSHLMINSLLGGIRTLGLLKTKFLVVRESTQVFGRYKGIKLFSYKLAYFFGYRSLDLVICQTVRMDENLNKNVTYLSKRTKTAVIPNPFDFPSKILEDKEIVFKNNYLVSAGRLIPEKGFDLLIDAFYHIKINQPDLILVILGEGEKRSELEEKVKDYNLINSVFLPGFVNNVYPYFRDAQLCVVSSRIEGFPNVLLQMMSQNHKVVSTLCAGGIREIPNLFLSETNNVQSLKKAITDALNTDTSNNRTIFDDFLKKRSVENFIKEIEKHLEHA